GRPIVADDHFEVAVGLRQGAADAGADEVLLVVGRNEDRDLGRGVGHVSLAATWPTIGADAEPAGAGGSGRGHRGSPVPGWPVPRAPSRCARKATFAGCA